MSVVKEERANITRDDFVQAVNFIFDKYDRRVAQRDAALAEVVRLRGALEGIAAGGGFGEPSITAWLRLSARKALEPQTPAVAGTEQGNAN